MLLGIAFLAQTQTSSAVPFTDTINYSPAQTVNHGAPFSDTFNLVPDGFTVGSFTATSGTATFDLSAGTGNQGNYKVIIDLATSQVVNKGGLQDYTFTLTSGLLTDVNADGKLTFTLLQDNSSVFYYLNSATLTVNADSKIGSNVSSVPDGGATAMLLGVSCLSLLGARSFLSRFSPAAARK